MRFSIFLLPALALLALIPRAGAQADTPPIVPMVTTPTSTASGIGLGTVTEYTLPNGLQVLVAPSEAADLVTMDVWVGAGTRRETADVNGVAHFMEHLIFKGTPTRKPGEIDAGIEDLGGSLNAATSYDWAHFYVTTASEDAPKALPILADALENSEMRQEDIDAEKPVILSEMAREASRATGRVSRAFNALAFPDHPYGRPLLGTAANVSAMPRQTIVDFYHTYYAPGNATLVLAGRITPEAGRALAEKCFGSWATRAVPDDKTLAAPTQTSIRTLSLTAPARRGFLQLGWRGPSVRDTPDVWQMDLLMTLLGQGGGSRLDRDLTDKRKLVTAIGTSFLTQRDPGMMSVTAEFDPGDYQRVIEAVLAEAAALRDAPVSEGELAAAKHSLLASYLFDAQTNSGRANALGFYSRIATYQYDTSYVSRFEAVTPAQLQAVARKYLTPTAYTQVTLLPVPNPVTASSQP